MPCSHIFGIKVLFSVIFLSHQLNKIVCNIISDKFQDKKGLPGTQLRVCLMGFPEGLKRISSHHARPEVRVVSSCPNIWHDGHVWAEMCIIFIQHEGSVARPKLPGNVNPEVFPAMKEMFFFNIKLGLICKWYRWKKKHEGVSYSFKLRHYILYGAIQNICIMKNYR